MSADLVNRVEVLEKQIALLMRVFENIDNNNNNNNMLLREYQNNEIIVSFHACGMIKNNKLYGNNLLGQYLMFVRTIIKWKIYKNNIDIFKTFSRHFQDIFYDLLLDSLSSNIFDIEYIPTISKTPIRALNSGPEILSPISDNILL